MATTTDNLDLTMPSENDFYDVNVFNENALKIDNVIGDVNAVKESMAVNNISDALAKVFQFGNEHKTTLVSNLIAMGVQADTSEDWGSLLAKILTIATGSNLAKITAETISLKCGESYVIPQGEHDGTGVVSALSLDRQTEGTAVANNIVLNKTAWVNGNKVVGVVPDKTGATVSASVISNDDTNVYISIPSTGMYSANSKLSVAKTTLANYV